MEDRVQKLNAYNDLLQRANTGTQTDPHPISGNSSVEGVNGLSTDSTPPHPPSFPPRIVSFLKQNHGRAYETYDYDPTTSPTNAVLEYIEAKDGRLTRTTKDTPDIVL
jgi:hypothetical protein